MFLGFSLICKFTVTLNASMRMLLILSFGKFTKKHVQLEK